MCKSCESIQKEDVCLDIVRRWYESNLVVDELDNSHVSNYYLFFLKKGNCEDGYYLCTNNDMGIKVKFCPWCGRELTDEGQPCHAH
jgi:hypothetical protein